MEIFSGGPNSKEFTVSVKEIIMNKVFYFKF